MAIITIHDFKGERNIAQKDNPGVQELVDYFIEKYEYKFLKSLLGKTLADEFLAGLLEDPIDSKWTELRDGTDLKEMLVDYVYFFYMENMTTTTAGTGENKAKNENSTVAGNWDKNVKAWNDMVKMTRLFDLSTETYPDFKRVYWRTYDYWYCGCSVDEIYYYKNTLNI